MEDVPGVAAVVLDMGSNIQDWIEDHHLRQDRDELQVFKKAMKQNQWVTKRVEQKIYEL